MSKKVLIDMHHTDLYRAFQLLFERRFGWEVYRPLGREWADRGYFYHPRDDEIYGLLTEQSSFDPSKHKDIFDASEGGVLWKDRDQDGILFRWLPLDLIHEVDLIVCSVYRNEEPFHKLKRDFGLKCPIMRYAGNGGELVDPSKFDIFIPAHLPLYEQYVKTGQKPGILYHPEFELDNGMYCWTPLPQGQQFVRTFLNFIYHHREPGTPYEQWCRYCGYSDEIGAKHLMHGLGTPPPGIEVELDVIIDRSFRAMGREDLLDRKMWPDLRFNRGEPPNHRTLSDLMKLSNIVIHPKPSPPEGYGFIVHQVAACGRPLVVPQWYRQLSASKFLQDGETCVYITGDDPEDKAKFKSAMEPQNNARMAETIRKRFDENVNFSAEAEAIRKLL